MSLLTALSNIIHKRDVRVANLAEVAGGIKEHNRKRFYNNITANNTAVSVMVAPWNGRIEDLWISSPTASTSSSGSHVTVTITDLTLNTTLLSFDTFTNTTELLLNQGIEIVVNGGISPSTGLPFTGFNAGDVIQLKIQVTGTPGPTSASVMPTLFSISSTDSHFAI